MSFGQVLHFATPLQPVGGWYQPTTGTARVSHPYPSGYMPPRVLQPIGNEDAWAYLRATRWPNPIDFPMEPLLRRPPCAPRSPDFYQPEYPGGPEWPTTAKPLPGAPIERGGPGYQVPSPALPPVGRGPTATSVTAMGPTEELTASEASEAFWRGGLGALGAAAALGLMALLWNRRRRKGRR